MEQPMFTQAASKACLLNGPTRTAHMYPPLCSMRVCWSKTHMIHMWRPGRECHRSLTYQDPWVTPSGGSASVRVSVPASVLAVLTSK
eukprot:scaffold199159_cov21-Tisochrysis_lutea.AAC.2